MHPLKLYVDKVFTVVSYAVATEHARCHDAKIILPNELDFTEIIHFHTATMGDSMIQVLLCLMTLSCCQEGGISWEQISIIYYKICGLLLFFFIWALFMLKLEVELAFHGRINRKLSLFLVGLGEKELRVA